MSKICTTCKGTGDEGGNPSYGPCETCGGKGRIEDGAPSAPEEPSNFALSISETLVEGETLMLTEQDLARLTEYERRVLQKTAQRCDYKAFYNLVSREVTLRKVLD